MLAVAAPSALAASLVEPSLSALHGCNGVTPALSTLFASEVHRLRRGGVDPREAARRCCGDAAATLRRRDGAATAPRWRRNAAATLRC